MQQVVARKPYPHLRALQELLTAEIALTDKKPQVAVEAAERALQFERSVVVQDALARAYEGCQPPSRRDPPLQIIESK